MKKVCRKLSAPYWTTGSDEKTPICFVDGTTANTQYGVDIKYGGPCPECHGPASVKLAFNPFDSYYYFHCPLCDKWIRYLDNTGALSDLKVVTSRKRTGHDIDIDFPEHWY